MWTILQDKFHHISPMSISRVFVDACNVKLLDCKDVVDYKSRYQIAFDKFLSLITEESWISRKSIEMALQGSLLRHLERVIQFLYQLSKLRRPMRRLTYPTPFYALSVIPKSTREIKRTQQRTLVRLS